MLRRTARRLVVYTPLDDASVPDKPIKVAASRHLSGRLYQMRRQLGMSDEEIAALAQDEARSDAALQGAQAGERAISASAAGTVELKQTWADVVAKREKDGKLYAPSRVVEMFPYLNGQPQGMAYWKDDLREEQLIAHLTTDSTHPMDTMTSLNRNRVQHAFMCLVAFLFGGSLVRSRLKQRDEEALMPAMYADYIVDNEEVIRHDKRTPGDELIPILVTDGGLQGIRWIPASRLPAQMWSNRGGVAHSVPVETAHWERIWQTMKEGGFMRNKQTYPAFASGLVDTVDSQVRWQQNVRRYNDYLKSLTEEQQIDAVDIAVGKRVY